MTNFFILPEHIFDDHNLSKNDLKLYMIINSFVQSKGQAFPSNAWISNRLGISRRGVMKCLNNLIKNGHIVKRTHNERRFLQLALNNRFERISPKKEVNSSSGGGEPQFTLGVNSSSPIINKYNNINNNITSNKRDNARASSNTEKPNESGFIFGGVDKSAFQDAKNLLPPEWEAVVESASFRALDKFLTRQNIIKVKSVGSLSPEQVQRSMDNYVQDIKFNNVHFSILMNCFTGGMIYNRKHGNDQVTQPSTLNALDARIQNQANVKNKQDEECKQREESLSHMRIACNEWSSNLSAEEMASIMEGKPFSGAEWVRKVILFDYYRENIWPNRVPGAPGLIII